MKILKIVLPFALLGSAGAQAPAQAIPPAPTIVEFLDGKFSMLAVDYRYELDGRSITIPRGFVTDFASVPSILHSAIGPHGRHSRAALIHDFLYWAQPCTRQQADNIMLRVMIESGVKGSDRMAIFKAVDWAGGKAWNDNRRRRDDGDMRMVPPAMAALPDGSTWQEALRRLREGGVRDPAFSVSQSFCELGNRS